MNSIPVVPELYAVVPKEAARKNEPLRNKHFRRTQSNREISIRLIQNNDLDIDDINLPSYILEPQLTYILAVLLAAVLQVPNEEST
jgi:hypothetical protein